MASCAYCNATIFFGGKRNGQLRYCNAKCLQQGVLSDVASRLPQADVASYIGRVHRGRCPECQGPGPVDVHTSFRVWSAVFMTQWSSRPVVSCKPCGTKRKLGDAAFSVALGWWGFPWGLVMTPIQFGRNLVALARVPDPAAPSATLEKLLRHHLAAQVVREQQQPQRVPFA